MNRRRERELDAYLDGALKGAAARRAARRAELDPDARRHLARREALSALTREAWTEGPPAPAPEYLISALRPQLSGIDAELAAERPARWSWGPLPVAALGTAALALALLIGPGLTPGPGSEGGEPAALVAATGAPPAGLAQSATLDPTLEAEAVFGAPSTVYDLALGEQTPVMLFETEDGSTVIWLIEEDDGLSRAPGSGGLV